MLSEDSGSPVDTVFVTERDGLPILRAVFDVHHFHSDEVLIKYFAFYLVGLYLLKNRLPEINARHIEFAYSRFFVLRMLNSRIVS